MSVERNVKPPARVASMSRGSCTSGSTCAERRIELFDVADLQHRAVPVGGPDQFLGFGGGHGERLFHQHVNAVPQQLHADRMVQCRRGRDDRRIDLADQFAIVGQFGRAGLRRPPCRRRFRPRDRPPPRAALLRLAQSSRA